MAKTNAKSKKTKLAPKKTTQKMSKQSQVPHFPNPKVHFLHPHSGTSRLSDHNVRRIGHGMAPQLPRYRRAG